MKIIISRKRLTIDEVSRVAYVREIKIQLSKSVVSKIQRARKIVDDIVEKEKVVYGINTGFGEFKNIVINKNQVRELQKNLIVSHSVGTGDPMPQEVVRAAMLLSIRSLAQGYSGIRLGTILKLIELLNKGVYPYVPSQGSVGCSGDLAPLSHIALVLLGKGEAWLNNKRVPSLQVLRRLRIRPIVLEAKEGLALNNGTPVMTAIAALNLKRVENLLKVADIASAMSLESCMGSLVPFHPSVQKLRPYFGQEACARNIRALCAGSNIIRSHKFCDRVQDSYSLRCIPQVHGAIREAVAHIRQMVETELESVTDNPLIFPEEKKIRSAGNFHGEPVALAMDFLGTAIADLGNISERRIYKMLDPATSEGLPAFLISKDKAGLDSGFMIAQYTAASLVAENKVYAHPVSVDSIPTSANQEDHVSFGTIAARKAASIIENVEKIFAIELLCSAQALDFRKPLKPGRGTLAAFREIRKAVPLLREDRILYKDLEKVVKKVKNGSITQQAEKAIGKLQ